MFVGILDGRLPQREGCAVMYHYYIHVNLAIPVMQGKGVHCYCF